MMYFGFAMFINLLFYVLLIAVVVYVLYCLRQIVKLLTEIQEALKNKSE